MPQQIEKLIHPSTQDQLDLSKIMAETGVLNPPLAFTAQAIANQQSLLLAGRFNDRLISLLQLQAGAEHYLITYLAVRKVTRNRGVAKRLLQLASAYVEGKAIACAEPESLWRACGFTCDPNSGLWLL